MKINHRGIRFFFRGLLVVALVVSIGIEIFIQLHADDLLHPSGSTQALQVAQEQEVGVRLPHGIRSRGSGPGWRGEIKVTQREDGENEVTISPVNTGGGHKPLTSFQVYLRSVDGKEEQDITEKFAKDGAEGLKASLKGTPAGPWVLRIRLHRELSTLEFTQRIDLK